MYSLNSRTVCSEGLLYEYCQFIGMQDPMPSAPSSVVLSAKLAMTKQTNKGISNTKEKSTTYPRI